MRKLIATTILIFAFSFSGSACLNRYFTVDKEGHAHDNGHIGLIYFYTNFNKEQLDWELYELEPKIRKEHSYMLLSDYAVILLKLGKTNEALQIFKGLYAHYPEEYQIASNLGTAYELHGDNDSALKYIRRGIELNPYDHEGSEWIHVKILETKIKLKEDPAWLKHNSVLQLTEEQKNDPQVCNQLNIQMQERFPFTSPVADPIMASLFTDLGDLYYNTKSVAIAIICYRAAREYYKASSTELDRKISEAEILNKELATTKPGEDQTKGRKAIILTQVDYESCFIDQDKKKFRIKWNEVLTDPKTLLALVNFSLPGYGPILEKNRITEDSTGKPKVYKDFKPAAKKMEKTLTPWEKRREEIKNSPGWISAIFLIVIFGIVFLIQRKQE